MTISTLEIYHVFPYKHSPLIYNKNEPKTSHIMKGSDTTAQMYDFFAREDEKFDRLNRFIDTEDEKFTINNSEVLL